MKRLSIMIRRQSMRERAFLLHRKRRLPILFNHASGILARFRLLAEIAEHRIDRSLKREFAPTDKLLHSFPFFLSTQSFELLVRIENQRRPGKTARLPRTVGVHSDDIKSLSSETK